MTTLAPPVARPLQIGPYRCDTPVVLAPMAGITNPGFRRLCREQGAGFYVCEMITSRGLVERNPLTFRMIAFDARRAPALAAALRSGPGDGRGGGARGRARAIWPTTSTSTSAAPSPRSPGADGGAALPYKRRLFERIVRAAVGNAGAVPVTVKMRIGIDDEHRTHLEAGRIAADAGVAAVALHARTAAQRYSGTADWAEIARLRDALPAELPVLGNGDIFSAADALAMVAGTGMRRRRRRPRLPRPPLAVRRPRGGVRRPARCPRRRRSGRVAATLRRHAELLCAHMGPDKGIRDVRKHIAWYLKGFPGGLGDASPARARRQPGRAGRAARHRSTRSTLSPTEADGPRGRQGSPGRVVLPERWLDDPNDPSVPFGAELEHSGG